jgi:hypothetical protein
MNPTNGEIARTKVVTWVFRLAGCCMLAILHPLIDITLNPMSQTHFNNMPAKRANTSVKVGGYEVEVRTPFRASPICLPHFTLLFIKEGRRMTAANDRE